MALLGSYCTVYNFLDKTGKKSDNRKINDFIHLRICSIKGRNLALADIYIAFFFVLINQSLNLSKALASFI